jgi:hypothetical protein
VSQFAENRSPEALGNIPVETQPVSGNYSNPALFPFTVFLQQDFFWDSGRLMVMPIGYHRISLLNKH